MTVPAHDVTNQKPDPEPTRLSLEKFDVDPDETLFVGDAIYDCLSARLAGFEFAFVNWSHSPFEKDEELV